MHVWLTKCMVPREDGFEFIEFELGFISFLVNSWFHIMSLRVLENIKEK